MIQRDFLLIDTCFLIDSYSHPELFTDFLNELNRNDCYLITIPQVKYEFIRSKTRDVVENKKVYFDQTIPSLIKTDRFDTNIEPLMLEHENV